jgi:hypothetical protein
MAKQADAMNLPISESRTWRTARDSTPYKSPEAMQARPETPCMQQRRRQVVYRSCLTPYVTDMFM